MHLHRLGGTLKRLNIVKNKKVFKCRSSRINIFRSDVNFWKRKLFTLRIFNNDFAELNSKAH